MAIMGIMTPKGLVPAILASLPLQMNLMHGTVIQDLAYSVVLVSILICSILVIVLNRKSLSVDSLNKMFRFKSEPADVKIENQEIVEAEIRNTNSNDDNWEVEDESFEE